MNWLREVARLAATQISHYSSGVVLRSLQYLAHGLELAGMGVHPEITQHPSFHHFRDTTTVARFLVFP